VALEPSSRIHLLVVDDERAIVEMLRIGLERQGFSVWSATGAQEALDLYRQHAATIPLALLDVRIPELDGPALLGELQQLNPALTCCFMSGSTEPYTEAELIKRGAIRVFPKPFSVAEVAAFLRQTMGQPERRGSLRLATAPTQVHVGGELAQMRDRSSGGVGLWLATPLPVGSVLGLRVKEKEAPECSLEVRHCRPDERGWLVGCRFVV
jgi:DNA-binding NtrC family response regulator